MATEDKFSESQPVSTDATAADDSSAAASTSRRPSARPRHGEELQHPDPRDQCHGVTKLLSASAPSAKTDAATCKETCQCTMDKPANDTTASNASSPDDRAEITEAASTTPDGTTTEDEEDTIPSGAERAARTEAEIEIEGHYRTLAQKLIEIERFTDGGRLR